MSDQRMHKRTGPLMDRRTGLALDRLWTRRWIGQSPSGRAHDGTGDQVTAWCSHRGVSAMAALIFLLPLKSRLPFGGSKTTLCECRR